MDFKINKEKWDVFLEVTKFLNDKFGIKPILYGSLGIQNIIGEFTEATDVDFMIDPKYITIDWLEFKSLIESLGFEIINEQGHEFARDDIIIGFGNEDEFHRSGVDPTTLTVSDLDGIRFRELTAKQYLLFYQRVYREDDRQEEKKISDIDKIRRLKIYIKDNDKP
jgi:predicted nucleotidyltransferase